MSTSISFQSFDTDIESSFKYRQSGKEYKENSKNSTGAPDLKTVKALPRQVQNPYQKNCLDTLIESMHILAKDYETQASFLSRESNKPDKLLAIFEEGYAAVEKLASAGIIDKGTIAKIKCLNFMIACLYIKGDQWTETALKNSPEWKAVRTSAKEILRSANWRN